MAATESEVLCEIEVLQSIYLDDLCVTRTQDRHWEVSLVLYPSTAEDSGSQFVRLCLKLTLDDQYPCSSPDISIHNPRGLSDDKLSSLQQSLELEAESCVGSPILYQLIEVAAVTLKPQNRKFNYLNLFLFHFVLQKAKEILTESNIPHGNCVICLYGFKEGESFSKTHCYHYFHSHCLGRYARHSEEEIRLRQQEMADDKTAMQHQELMVVCPVCREPLIYNLDQLTASTAPQLPELDGAAIRSKFQQKWRELEKILDRQRCRGGVIDPEEESNRFLIHINEAPPPPSDGSGAVDPLLPTASELLPPTAQPFTPPPTHCTGTHRQPQAHRRHSYGKGPKRGGGHRTNHLKGGAPISEHLDSLRLSSEPAEAPPGPMCENPHAHVTLCQTESHFSGKHMAGGRAQRARRKGPQHSAHGGPSQYHRWDARAQREGAPGGLPQHHRWDARAQRGGAPRQQRVGGPEEEL
ncbi:E3 ubiquitin-protein ligase RNF25 isoform X1 [Syngnathus acus]|uniref:E3 ubiquitin-protein ligase RNF25 isoform X1 n=1 Tax=Syngnathus acus TaxID=161584 RepID=UPI0018860010|nr:E3 ubiquitin-protein ligase RNF25 isoform X1 [Syngnathus acus]